MAFEFLPSFLAKIESKELQKGGSLLQQATENMQYAEIRLEDFKEEHILELKDVITRILNTEKKQWQKNECTCYMWLDIDLGQIRVSSFKGKENKLPFKGRIQLYSSLNGFAKALIMLNSFEKLLFAEATPVFELH